MTRLLKAACLAAVVALAGCASNQMKTAGMGAGTSSTVKTKSTKLAYAGNAERPVLFPGTDTKAKSPAKAERQVLFPADDDKKKPAAEADTLQAMIAARMGAYSYAGAVSVPELEKAAKKKSAKGARVAPKTRKKPVVVARTSTGKAKKSVRVVTEARTAPVKGGRMQDAVTRHAEASGVPVKLAHAVVRVESNYRASARGAAGEIGLMQVKLSTARLMGYRGSARGLYDPDTNLKYGMMYLAKAHQLGGGSVCGTILKYNAGHGAKRMNPVSQRYCSKVKGYM